MSTFPAYPSGLGHIIQGRYMERGWIFTVGGLVLGGGLLYFGLSFIENAFSDTGEDQTSALGVGAVACLFGIVGLKIWEIADAWMLPSHYKESIGKPIELSPLYAVNKRGRDHFGLSLKYKF